MAREYKNLQGEKYHRIREKMKKEGFDVVVTYNNTDNLFYFIDRFFKSYNNAEKFFNSLKTDKKIISIVK